MLFTLGKFGLEQYLAHVDVASGFGAAGAMAILLVWVYYSAQIFFFGAEFTEVYSRHLVQAAPSGPPAAPEEVADSDESRRRNGGLALALVAGAVLLRCIQRPRLR